MKAVVIAGEPASGKSTLTLAAAQRLGLGPLRSAGLVKFHELGDARTTILLGDYSAGRTRFQGTDALSMAVAPAAREFVLAWTGALLWEGDRLTTQSFLSSLLSAGRNLTLVILGAPDFELERRHRSRNDTQGRRFLTGRKTKVKNLSEWADGALREVYRWDSVSPEDLRRNTDRLAELMR